jgi:hypothetical protein
LFKEPTRKVSENGASHFSELSRLFLQNSRSILYENVTVKVGYCKFCTGWVPENVCGRTQNAEDGFGRDFPF